MSIGNRLITFLSINDCVLNISVSNELTEFSNELVSVKQQLLLNKSRLAFNKLEVLPILNVAEIVFFSFTI